MVINQTLLRPCFKMLRLGRCLLEALALTQSSMFQKSCTTSSNISRLFVPVPVHKSPDEISSIGNELAGVIKKSDVLRILNKLYQAPHIRSISRDNGLDSYLFQRSFLAFRKFCVDVENLPPDIYILFSDILRSNGHVDDLIPYFLRHAKAMFPHLDCMDDLRKISDLRQPADWYSTARSMNRRIIFHCGPTNSGKTYHALERFCTVKNGVYCGPLKLLAAEVFDKCNERGVSCDLVTGEERRYGLSGSENNHSPHVACTVEMTSITSVCEVAVIDEIQMIRDPQRGWAWTRCLLGVPASEVHVCGEKAALPLVEEIALCMGEEVEVRQYKRLSPLRLEEKPVASLDDVKRGDCIVCFNKNDIFHLSHELENRGIECAVIYGSLPPGAKLSQARRFNDPYDPCKVLIATDAIGMGLNLSIRRVVFNSLIKPHINASGEKEMDVISCSQAHQIAGRAGRHGTEWAEGFVTTRREQDLTILKRLLNEQPPDIKAAGIHPTSDQIELYGYHLPNATLSNLMNIFVGLSTVDDSMYFLCQTEAFRFLADMIEHIPLPLRVRYVFCCSPIDRKVPFVCNMFLKFARQYSRQEPVTVEWLCAHIGWPFTTPVTLVDLVQLEHSFDVLDLYLWLSYRFRDLFPDGIRVREMQSELDSIIQSGVANIINLLRNTNSAVSEATKDRLSDEDSYTARRLRQSFIKAKKGSSDISRLGKLTNRLITQGLLTPKMMEDLHKEWSQKDSADIDSEEEE